MIPEPFSITTGVLGIIGFLNLAGTGAQALYKDVQAYQDAPKDVLKFWKDAKLVDYQIDLWKRAWLIRPDSHQDWPVELWGERGWESICHLIDTLESLSQSIDDMFEPYLKESVADQPMASTSGGNHASAPSIAADALRRRAMDKGNKDRLAASMFWLQKISYALANRENLKTHFDQYKGLIDSLCSMSKEAYFECHNVTRCITNRERREMTIKSMLVAQALKTRDASWALHHSCKSAGKGVVELELSLLRWKLNENTGRPFHSGIPERLCYYVTLTPDAPDSPEEPPGGAPERKLELLFERRNSSPMQCIASFAEVCAALSDNQTAYLRCPCVSETQPNQRLIFKCCTSDDPFASNGRRQSSLKDLITSSATRAQLSEMSLRDRVEAAYRIAECSFLLLGTCWLSAMESAHITRSSSTSGGAEPRYRVLVGPCLGDNDGLFNLQTQRLGQLLRELALGSDFTSSYDNERDFILLVREVGEQYQKAIDFCCKRPPPGSALSLRTRKEYDNYYTGILADFFEHVVLPLARLHQSNVSSVPWNPEQDDALTFLPTTFTDRPPRPLGGQIPELSSSDPVPNTFLGSLTTTLRAMSTKRASRLGGMGKSDVIVYYVSTKKFAKLPRADVPDHAHELMLSGKSMKYRVNVRPVDAAEAQPLVTVDFGRFGLRTMLKRRSGKIDRLFIVDDLFQDKAIWDIAEELEAALLKQDAETESEQFENGNH